MRSNAIGEISKEAVEAGPEAWDMLLGPYRQDLYVEKSFVDLEIQRKGRGFPLAKSYRENLLKGLDAWEKKMRDVGVIDTLGITMAIRRHTKKIKAKYITNLREALKSNINAL